VVSTGARAIVRFCANDTAEQFAETFRAPVVRLQGQWSYAAESRSDHAEPKQGVQMCHGQHAHRRRARPASEQPGGVR